MSCTKQILSSSRLRSLYTHWPTLDDEKIARFRSRTTKKARLFDRAAGRSVEGIVLETDPILIAPYEDSHMVLNGKHRSVLAIRRGCGLLAYSAEKVKDFEHCIPPKLYSDFEIPPSVYGRTQPMKGLEAIQYIFANMQMFHERFCVPQKVVRIGDHLPQLREY